MADIRNLSYAWASSERDMSGVWVDVGGVRFKLRTLSPKNRAMMIFMARHKVTELRGDMAILPELLADVVVVDWDGISDANGEAIAYSKDTALELLTLHPMLTQQVWTAAISLNSDDLVEPAQPEEADTDAVKKVSAG